jgi:hypothetical protein
VALNALTDGIDFAVAIRGRIGGTVRDSTGNPLPWAGVNLFAWDGNYAGYTSAESDGSYAFVVSRTASTLTAEEWGGNRSSTTTSLPSDCDVTGGTWWR